MNAEIPPTWDKTHPSQNRCRECGFVLGLPENDASWMWDYDPKTGDKFCAPCNRRRDGRSPWPPRPETQP